MNTVLRVVAILLALACSTAAMATPSTDFVVSPDRGAFYPATPFRSGDRLQVTSPYLMYGDLVSLNRCLDSACTDSEVVRIWRANPRSRPDVLAFVTIQQDGTYFFSPRQIPVTLQPSARGCWAGLVLHNICDDAAHQKFTEVKAEPAWFRARLSSGGWFWVRKIAEGAPQAAAPQANDL